MSRAGRSPLPPFLELLPVVVAHAQWIPPNPVIAVQRQSNEVLFSLKQGVLRLQACSDSIVVTVNAEPTYRAEAFIGP
jgi:hypothetical protein